MKLTPILFSERAPTPDEAFSGGLVALKLINTAKKHSILLANTSAAKRVFARTFKADPNKPKEESELSGYLAEALSKNTIVGAVKYQAEAPGVFRVLTSVGVSKHGPLTYQLVMQSLNGAWLKSDTVTLTEKSAKVWSKMYELSEQGVYERAWLGSLFGHQQTKAVDSIEHARSIATRRVGKAFDYEGNLWNEGKLPGADGEGSPVSERDFLSWLKTFRVTSPRQVGWFWAYRLGNLSLDSAALFEAGEQLVADLTKEYKINPEVVHAAFDVAGDRFFKSHFEGA